MGRVSFEQQRAGTWIRGMMSELAIADARKALKALRAGLLAVRHRLSVDAAARLAAQLPIGVRGVFLEGGDRLGLPSRFRRKDAFLALIQDSYGARGDLAPEEIVAAVFRLLARHIDDGELAEVWASLPEDVAELACGDADMAAAC